jgi:SH3-like domain-containing protein
MRRGVLSLLLACAACSAAVAQTPCNIEASINNGDAHMTTDPNGTNVRAGPGKEFPITKTLKDEMGFRFHITVSSGSWVRVDHVREIANGREAALVGWVYTPSLFLKPEPDGRGGTPVFSLFAAPDAKGRRVLKLEAEDDVLTLRGCRGRWAKVSLGGTVGWLSPGTQCADLWDVCGER